MFVSCVGMTFFFRDDRKIRLRNQGVEKGELYMF